ncbi:MULTISPECIES: hypothetical protein [Pandoraea]|uniref:hypothetical protein n=1 Tax=Pandoraea TaxID=93217 RepID=UPI001F5CCEA9|nr:MULTISPECIES: hypothetical protein [Pandoraea]MCI3206535.1 hypothetical protein [Pandoraea sp. LA3]MDN4584563.1 hypothetical protein [Pandoraea capi]
MILDGSFLTRLLAPMRDALRRIARASKNEYEVEDLESEAYLEAVAYVAENGDVAPEDAALQEGILTRLMRRFGFFANYKDRGAYRLDQESRTDDGEFVVNSVAARLTADVSTEPAEILERAQREWEQEETVSGRFSEAVAYLRTFQNFHGGKVELASYLAIHPRTLDTRLRRAMALEGRQPSMFDGIEILSEDFHPAQGLLRRRRAFSKFHRICGEARPWQAHLYSRVGSILLRG